MKKILWIVGSIVLLMSLYVVYSLLTTRQHSPADTATISSAGTEIKVDYCRPYKKGRDIFGGLVPYNNYWRTGANEPTIIRFSNDVSFGGESVAAGDYRLYTIPGESQWKVVLNGELESWGAWEPDYDLDVLSVNVPVEKIADVQEQFLITLAESEQGANLAMLWDQTKVSIPINF